MKRIFFVLSLVLMPCVAQTNEIHRIQNADGSIEFSNTKTYKNRPQTTIYSYSERNRGTVFTDQKPTHTTDYQILKFDCYACDPHSQVNWHTVKLHRRAYHDTISKLAKQYQVEPALVKAIIHAESAFNPSAQSQKGATGLMQLMPATAKELGVIDAFNPEQNIRGGVKYLSQLLAQFEGNTRLASAAYNAGPNAVKKYHGVPPYEETQVYVDRVAILFARYKGH
jgi:hypothetical protein